VAVDGPRPQHSSDSTAVNATLNELERIDWTSDVSIHAHNVNQGISTAIPWAISWILNEFDCAIIIEEDVTVGPDFLNYASRALEIWGDHDDIYSISGYNMVPESYISRPDLQVRFSSLVHSYAWATWRQSWACFDPAMTWFTAQSVETLGELLGSRWAALRWKQFAAHVRHGRVSTWDYQWAMSIWEQGGKSVMPNKNLVAYNGQSEGTHTFRRQNWSERPVEPIDVAQLHALNSNMPVDVLADSYAQRYGQQATPLGVLSGYLEAPAMRALRQWQRFASR